MELKDRIRQVRGTLTQRECAKRLGIHTSTWQQYEFGNVPKGDILQKMHKEFQVDLNWLLTGKACVHIEPPNEIGYPHVAELGSGQAKQLSLIKKKPQLADCRGLPRGNGERIQVSGMDSLSPEELALVRSLRICGDEYRKRVYAAVSIKAGNILEEETPEPGESSEVRKDLELLSLSSIE
jgi:transcriptional regulator with XRE-family HTH domain